MTTNESFVEVSPSTVIRLKLESEASFNELIETRRGNRSVGADVREHRRHVGPDHAGALGDSGDHTSVRRSYDERDNAFGPVSVVMIARAAAFPRLSHGLRQPCGIPSLNFGNGNR